MSRVVLIVDDSAMIRQQVGKVLRAAGLEVFEAVDGMDAVDKLQTLGTVSLIVCDVNMPRMTGLEFLEAAQERISRAAIPVVMLTTEGQPELLQRAKRLGARAWIIKPFKPELFVAAIQKLIGPPMAKTG
ncbi:MAG: response regulator [Myxococcota bacterium]